MKANRSLLVAIFVTTFTLNACSGSDDPASCSISGYRTVQIGTQTWMAENLNCNISGSKCYGEGGLSNAEVQANCVKYGRLYSWETAMKACIDGWHLPSNDDWDKLVYYVEREKGCLESGCAGAYLKATSDWNGNGNGTDDYGFSALPGGGGLSNVGFDMIGYYGVWWSATVNRNGTYIRNMTFESDAVREDGSTADLFSVRCVQD